MAETLLNPEAEYQETLRRVLTDPAARKLRASDALNTAIASQVAALRTHRAWTQQQLASRAGTTQAKISNIETVGPDSNPEIDTLLRIARAFDVRLRVSFETFGSIMAKSFVAPPTAAEDPLLSREDADPRRDRLRRDLNDPQYREAYATTVLYQNVSAQVKALRRQRGLTQDDLARLADTRQAKLSEIENAPDFDEPPNWALSTLKQIAYALGVTPQIAFEPYSSLLAEIDCFTSDSLRRPLPEDDPLLLPRHTMPSSDPAAPEPIRAMQLQVIRWLWDDSSLNTPKLLRWMTGEGLPSGYDDQASRWILDGIPKHSLSDRDCLERRLAERLSVVLGAQPDVEPIVAGQDNEFLCNVYYTCAGVRRPGFLAEHLWLTYQRLKQTKLRPEVRDALQAALVNNQFGDKPFRQIWKPMIETGSHPWLRGNELVGFEGLLVRAHLDELQWALGCISHRWSATDAGREHFIRLLSKVPAAQPDDSWAPWITETPLVAESLNSRR